ncbi:MULTISPECIES: 3-oxo-isoapionate-4-phosphate decarboxylase OiaX [unclassified Mesorhizobium]|uniref:3-oxo-isoapionate-4-phosphate decarboxylase OiaX n=1 Tax=unclassified Mesorhizobium TaxID=325217 RepID=UPI001CCFAF09|nr:MULTISPECIES: 3-oxo-isoapionate-4-phosphate decarboxylase OiaX [unclassified Mesorhizobium]MBZ9734520.1 ribulose-bisphosphate carboxylase large subunit family protein [Mesorhizobium sp. CA9]MBZ9812155.1 ribulose-bisphosphate carboxylase large subunit family protein [Mesorhizobium sp. CA7]MBZ9826944.1 ribulose-bisphosphate carboxylase large subunit family protein [Mesorhizobium sp. CA18]MBZ9832434.1 ribulose-bisphosphate carboxylase large subunit family protein [Mesorhizobium sp. CA2]MBZ9838
MITLTYRIETSGSIEGLAAKIASDQSTGTFVALPGETEELKARVAARVLAIRHLPDTAQPSIPEAGSGPFKRADVDIAFPLDAIGTDLAALMTIAIGGTYSIRGLSGVRVIDMKLPEEFKGAHPGPQFGISGSRRLTGVEGRPIIGTIVKPALGLRPHETAEIVGELIGAGVDFIKDDEKLMSPAYSPLPERVKAIMPLILDHEQKTGKKVMYAFGISHADPDQMMRNHDLVLEAGGNCAVVNINSIGFGGMAFLRKRSGLALHAHRNGWDILTRHPGLGMDFKVWQQFWRLLGVDQFQINGIGSKYWEPDDSFIRSFEAVTTPVFSPEDCALPVACSGQWGGQAPETYRRTGRTIDLLYLCGGGIVSHPDGPGAGVRAVLQAWHAAVEGIPLTEFAKAHVELARSIEKFADGKAA